jgi:ribosomal-protein-alanine N-acetyltransferase
MVLETDRGYLREVRISDVNEHYYNWLNDWEVIQFLESRFFPNSTESLQKYVESKIGDRDNLFLAIVLRSDNRHIGNIKLGPINWIHRTGDIGVLIGQKDCWGKGYATEAIKLLVDHAFRILNLKKVTASAYDVNRGSIKAFENAGFEIEGVRKEQCYFEGRYVNSVLLGRVNKADA